MDRVIFLDRDGTLNEEVHYLHRKEDLKLLDGVPQAICMLRERGYKIVVVTNQAGVARGYYSEADVKKLHDYMNEKLRPWGAEIDRFFYCPHHPEYGIGSYKIKCRCRKPGTGMFEMAEQYFEVDKAHSWMIGDKLIDIKAGRNYGVHTILVGTGYGKEVHQEQLARLMTEQEKIQVDGAITRGGGKLPYDVYAETLADAARAVLEGEDDSRRTGRK